MLNDDEIQLVQIPNLNESVPFTIGPSRCTDSHISYTFSGSRASGLWGVALLLLGVCFLPGSVMLTLSPWTQANSKGFSAVATGLVIGLFGLVFLYYGVRQIRRSGLKYQIEVDRVSGDMELVRGKQNPLTQSEGVVLFCGMIDINSSRPKIKYWCVSIVANECWVVLAALGSENRAREFAEVVCDETNLQLMDQSQTHAITAVYFEDMVRSDAKALKTPMKSKPIRR